MSVHFTNAQTGYVVGGDINSLNPLLKTTDGGTTWVWQSFPTSGSTNRNGGVHGFQAVYFPCADTGYIVGEGSAILKTATGGTGVEENGQGVEGPRVQGFKAAPNPFTSFARVPGHDQERFALYDITGRKVAIYKGDRIGEGLRAGVYFLKPEDREGKPLRIVKVR
jgi:hypothetical protein